MGLTNREKARKSFWKGRKVLVTGHTGFKGSWLVTALNLLGAECIGISRGESETSSISLSSSYKNSLIGYNSDIKDITNLFKICDKHKPEFIFHLAAQPLVEKGYEKPFLTFQDNVIGTLNVLEAARQRDFISTTLVITTDKVYRNEESIWPYRETDPLQGTDPYSASKSAADIISQSYGRCFFQRSEASNLLVARGGNVLGGGDLSKNRIIPDYFRAKSLKKPLYIRNKNSVRPWQHVIDLIIAYIIFVEQADVMKSYSATALNFGPNVDENINVENLIRDLNKLIPGDCEIKLYEPGFKETDLLRLDTSLAKKILGWSPTVKYQEMLELLSEWYLSATDFDHYELAKSQLQRYLKY